MDYVNKAIERLGLPKFLDHWRYTALATFLVSSLAGCAFIQPKAPSLVDPKLQVTRPQLDAEVESFLARAKASYAELEREELLVQELLSQGSALIKTIPGPWGGILGAALATFSLALTADNRRKDSVISDLKGTKRGN